MFYRNIKYEPANDEDSLEIVENNVKICYGNNQDIKYDSKVSYSNRIN